MATVTVKNIPDDLYARLKEAAARNRRSINSEIIARIEGSLVSRRVPTEQIVGQARSFHASMNGREFQVEQYDEARRAGRP